METANLIFAVSFMASAVIFETRKLGYGYFHTWNVGPGRFFAILSGILCSVGNYLQ